jgi:hypothetical protein
LTLLGLVLLLGLLLLLLVLLLMIVGLERAQHEYGMSNEQGLNIQFQTYYTIINTSKLKSNNSDQITPASIYYYNYLPAVLPPFFFGLFFLG